MPFDAYGSYSLPHSWAADKDKGIGADATRFDAQEADIAAAITALRAKVDAINASSFNPSLYYSRTQIDGLLLGKQDKLTYTPVSVADIGVGIAPLVNGKVPDQYLPVVSQSTGLKIATINGRAPDSAGNFGLTSTDVTNALGYTPDAPGSTRDMAQINGLVAALAGKQAALGFTPATQTSVDALSASLAGKQNTLTNPATFSTSEVATVTSLPTGSFILVSTTGVTTVKKRQAFQVYLGATDTDPYNLVNSGAQLEGVWVCCGVLTGNIAGFQRVS